MKYKLLVLDVDGTLLNNQKEISPRTLAALLKVQQMGYILSYNGGQIINVQTGELLFEKRIDPEWIPYFEKKAKKNDFAIFTYHKDFILTDKPDNKYVIQEANLNKMQIVGVDNFAEAVDFPPCKCMLASDDEEGTLFLRSRSPVHRQGKHFGRADDQTVRIAGRSDRDRRRRLRRDHVATCRCRDRDGKCGRFGEGLCGQDDTHQRRRRRSRGRRTDNPG